MATSAHRRIQDQNLNILYNGAQTDAVKAENKRRVAGRKALNDISNSRKLSANVISIEKDPVAVAKAKLPKATEKGKASGRKALTDVTNSVKQLAAKQGPSSNSRKLGSVAEEGFLHNHHECVKAQAKGVDVGYFLKSVGLSNDIHMKVSASRAIPLSSKKPEINIAKHWEMEELLFEDREAHQCCSPACRSPQTPRAPYMSWDDEKCFELTVIDTPRL
ncbi:hypothetical protein CASFOL_002083 [Castilleja foliolosa]|uniref:Uncharacterized protein n=1 Tax=Castilleja foliolosa TaxID=1961234 RepID=A0ABD3EF61_9LAMI